MTLVSIGDLARSMMLQSGIGQGKSSVQKLLGEMSTGRHADQAKVMRGDFAPLAAIEASLARLTGWTEATTDLGLRMGIMQNVLGSVDRIGQQLSQQLLTATETENSLLVGAAGRDARQQFATTVGLLNTRFGDRSLFAGAATDRPALASSEDILDDLMVAVSGTTNAEQAVAAVALWFSSPTGFAASGYTGSSSLAGPVATGPGEASQIDVTAADPALRETLTGLALAALLDRGLFAGNAAAQTGVAKVAGLQLFSNAASRANVAAGLGATEARVAASQARNAAETTTLKLGRAGMIVADPETTVTELEAAQTRLETLYALTARVSRLNLTDFLR